MMLGKYLGVLGVVLTLWGCHHHCPGPIPGEALRGQEIRPYTGLLRNFSATDISIPSQDSGATLILPAGGQMEYTVWKPNVEICGYVERTQVYYKNMTIGPGTKYSYFGKTYDFLAEVCPELPVSEMRPRQCPPPYLGEPEPRPRPRPGVAKRVCPG